MKRRKISVTGFFYSPLLGKSLHLSYHPAGGRYLSRKLVQTTRLLFTRKKPSTNEDKKNMYKFIEPNWPLCLKVILQNKALCDQNKGQLGSRKGNPQGTFSGKNQQQIYWDCVDFSGGLVTAPEGRHLLISLSNFQSWTLRFYM